MYTDLRTATGDFLWSWLVGGLKGARFALSPAYRRRVRRYWGDYPSARPRGIRRMLIGGAVDLLLAGLLLGLVYR